MFYNLKKKKRGQLICFNDSSWVVKMALQFAKKLWPLEGFRSGFIEIWDFFFFLGAGSVLIMGKARSYKFAVRKHNLYKSDSAY